MSSSAELQLAYKVGNAPVNPFPFPHFYVQDVFPGDFYDLLQANLPDPAAMLPIGQVRPVKGYKERFVMAFGGAQLAALPDSQRAFWTDFHGWLVGGRLGQLIIDKFGPLIDQRFRNPDLQLYDEALLVEDTTNYSLGPHSDAPRKVITFLFYLPKDESQRHLGTSLYVPKETGFRCAGGPHYPHDRFERVCTMPFLPNSLFVFFKNDVSFHGVEPIKDADCRRWLLLYDMYVVEPAKTGAAPGALTGAAAAPAVKFSF